MWYICTIVSIVVVFVFVMIDKMSTDIPKNQYLTFNEAKVWNLVHLSRIKLPPELLADNASMERIWLEMKRNNKLPKSMPITPSKFYKEKWKGWKDFIYMHTYASGPTTSEIEGYKKE